MSNEESKETIADKAKAQIDALKTKEGRDALKEKAKKAFSTATMEFSQQVTSFKTKEGRAAFVGHIKNMSAKRKIAWGVGMLITLLVLFKLISYAFVPSEQDNSTQAGNVSRDGKISIKGGKSPIEGLLGYKLGEVLEGGLGNKAILVGPDWYCVGNRAEFHDYKTCVMVLPQSKRVCAIHISSSTPGINLQTELATVETMLRKKYKDIEFEKLSELETIWKPKSGSRVLIAGILQHPLSPCVKIEVHDLALESLMKEEKNNILQNKANQEAERAGDVL